MGQIVVSFRELGLHVLMIEELRVGSVDRGELSSSGHVLSLRSMAKELFLVSCS
jgi:hypothetical protein